MPRTPGATNIPDYVKKIITREATADLSEVREAVVIRIQKLLSDLGERSLERETLLKMISDVRNTSPSQLDEPWSLGVSERFNIPHDATADLLALWKRTIPRGPTFTVRKAIWASRLRKAVPATPERNRLGELLHMAARYAAEERVAEALETALDTRFLDSDLAFRKEDGSSDHVQLQEAARSGAFQAGSFDGKTVTALEEKVGYDKAHYLLLSSGEYGEISFDLPAGEPIDSASPEN